MERQPGDGPAGIFVSHDPLDRFRRRHGVLEPTGVDDHRHGLAHCLAGNPDLGPVAVHDKDLGRGDRWARNGELGDPLAADADQMKAAVGPGRRGGERQWQMVEAVIRAPDALIPGPG